MKEFTAKRFVSHSLRYMNGKVDGFCNFVGITPASPDRAVCRSVGLAAAKFLPIITTLDEMNRFAKRRYSCEPG